MVNMTDAVLATTLKELLSAGLITHRQYDEILPRVEYALTEKGESVVPILQTICRWSGVYYRDDPENALPQCKVCDYGASLH